MEYLNHTSNATASYDLEYEEGGNEEAKEEVNAVTKIAIVGAYVIIFLFALVGNSLIIHIVRTCGNIRKNPFNWLLVNTAAADLVDVMTASAFSIPYFLCGDCWVSGIVGALLCKLIPFFLVVSICTSIWTLTVIAADRYLAIVCIGREPLSQKAVMRSIVAVWLFSGVVCSGQLYKFKAELSEEMEPLCEPEWHEDEEISILLYKVEMIVRVIITYSLPLLIMAALYSLIAFHLRRHETPGSLSRRQKAFVKQVKKRRGVIKMMIITVTLFAVCWFPVHISHIMADFYSDTYDNIPRILIWLLSWFAHANSAMHPWLFIIFSENLRMETKRIFQVLWCRKPSQLKDQNRGTSLGQGVGYFIQGAKDGTSNVEFLTSRYLTSSHSDTKL